MSETAITGYRYPHASLNHSHGILLPSVLRLLENLKSKGTEPRLFELGCGNGSVATQ